MGSKLGASNFLFCFHRKFDTGTWSIAAAFSSLIIFSSLFVIILAYSVPTCACPLAYEHISILPPLYQILYAVLLLFIAILNASAMLVIYGTFKVQEGKLLLYIFLMVVVEIATFVGSIFVFKFIYNIEEYLLLDNDTYAYIAELVLKTEVQEKLTIILENLSGIFRLFLQIDPAEILNLDNLMNAALKEEVLAILGGMKQMMKVSVVILLIAINSLFICSILVVSSHHHKLRKGVLSTYSGVPELVLPRELLSSSTKTVPSDSLSDASETPLHMKPLGSHAIETSKQAPNGVNFKDSAHGRTKDSLRSSRGSRRTRVTASAPGCKSNKGEFV